jgi:hypothetical protein
MLLLVGKTNPFLLLPLMRLMVTGSPATSSPPMIWVTSPSPCLSLAWCIPPSLPPPLHSFSAVPQQVWTSLRLRVSWVSSLLICRTRRLWAFVTTQARRPAWCVSRPGPLWRLLVRPLARSPPSQWVPSLRAAVLLQTLVPRPTPISLWVAVPSTDPRRSPPP